VRCNLLKLRELCLKYHGLSLTPLFSIYDFGIDREGLITLWNPVLHSLLKVDVWSRRHFEDVFGPDSQLAVLLRDCAANGRTCQGEKVEYAVAPAETKTLCVSAMPWRTQHGDIGGVVCLLSELKQSPE